MEENKLTIPSTLNDDQSLGVFSAIEIEGVPYDVEFQGNKMMVRDCFGSVLGNLNNDPEFTGNRFSDEKNGTIFLHDDYSVTFLDFSFDDETDTVAVEFSPNIDNEDNRDIFIEWLSDNIDSIREIGYETLCSEDSISKTIKESGYTVREELEDTPSTGNKP